MLFIYLLVFFLGLCLGSFLNVIGYRIDKKESWIKGRSYCDHCRKKLRWYDNIPLFSFILLKGRCRFCRQKISWMHPIIEFLTALLFLGWFNWFFSFNLSLLIYWQAVLALLIMMTAGLIFIIDLKYLLIPDSAIIILLIAAVLNYLLKGLNHQLFIHDLQSILISSLLLTVFFFCLWLITKGKGFGLGDVKLIGPLALLLGFPQNLVAVFLAFIFGAIAGIILIVSKKKTLKQVIPFGPFLILAAGVSQMIGLEIWSWYWGLI